ncbi:hypothetical protein HDU96_005066, partial [Phlyctochytrium bullatum]
EQSIEAVVAQSQQEKKDQKEASQRRNRQRALEQLKAKKAQEKAKKENRKAKRELEKAKKKGAAIAPAADIEEANSDKQTCSTAPL